MNRTIFWENSLKKIKIKEGLFNFCFTWKEFEFPWHSMPKSMNSIKMAYLLLSLLICSISIMPQSIASSKRRRRLWRSVGVLWSSALSSSSSFTQNSIEIQLNLQVNLRIQLNFLSVTAPSNRNWGKQDSIIAASSQRRFCRKSISKNKETLQFLMWLGLLLIGHMSFSQMRSNGISMEMMGMYQSGLRVSKTHWKWLKQTDKEDLWCGEQFQKIAAWVLFAWRARSLQTPILTC